MKEKSIKRFKEFNINESKLNNPHEMIVGYKYKITEPVYDDYDESLKPETDLVEVLSKSITY